MKPAEFQLTIADTLQEALAVKAKFGDEISVLAGGQSLVALMNFRLATPGRILDIGRIRRLRQIHIHEGRIFIGAMCTYDDLIRAAKNLTLPIMLLPILENIASGPVRNRATIGGALAMSDPKAEFPALAVALDGTVVVGSVDRVRRLSLHDFFVGYMQTSLASNEIILGIEFCTRRWALQSIGYAHVTAVHGAYSEAGVILRIDSGTEMLADGLTAVFINENDVPQKSAGAAEVVQRIIGSDSIRAIEAKSSGAQGRLGVGAQAKISGTLERDRILHHLLSEALERLGGLVQ